MPVCYNHASMMICKKIISTITAAAAAVALFTVSVPVALAGSDNASRKAITSSRSFPKMNTARKDLLKEIVSVSSDDSESWGGVESLNVPETKSTAEKKAEEEAKKAEEERKAAEKAAAEASRLQAAEVSRSRASAATSSTSSSSVSNDGAVDAPVSANGAGVVAYASQFQGVPYVYGGTTPSGFDCSGFTQYVYAKFGISLPRIDYQQRVWAQAHGTTVSDPQPGDLMWRSGHVGIYVGNGLMIHAPRPGKSVSIVPVYASFEYYRII